MTSPPAILSAEPRKGRLWDHARTVFLAVLLALGIRTGLAQAYLVEGPSMEPTLENGQRVLVVKYPYGLTLPASDEALVVWSRPARGDVVILSSPIDGTDLVKRVVALEGDIVEIRDGSVLVNGVSIATGRAGDCALSAPDGCLEEEESVDTARWTTRRSIESLPESIAPMRVPPGYLFVLGDHRDRSNDSRYFGPVAIPRVRGRVVF